MSAHTVNVRVSPGKGPVRACFSVEFEMHFNPLDAEQAQDALNTLRRLLREFGSPEQVAQIEKEFEQKLSEAAADS